MAILDKWPYCPLVHETRCAACSPADNHKWESSRTKSWHHSTSPLPAVHDTHVIPKTWFQQHQSPSQFWHIGSHAEYTPTHRWVLSNQILSTESRNIGRSVTMFLNPVLMLDLRAQHWQQWGGPQFMCTIRLGHSNRRVQERVCPCPTTCLWPWAGCHDENRHQGYEGGGLEMGRSGTWICSLILIKYCFRINFENREEKFSIWCFTLGTLCPGWTCTRSWSSHWRAGGGWLDKGPVGYQ